jgi:hypothetical protein
MSASEQADDQAPAESAEQVTELFDSLDGTKVIETEEFSAAIHAVRGRSRCHRDRRRGIPPRGWAAFS